MCLRLAPLLLLVVCGTLRAGADAPSTGRVEVVLGGQAVPDTLAPLDSGQSLSVEATAAWWDPVEERFRRLGIRLQCEGAYPSLVPGAVITLAPADPGALRSLSIRPPKRSGLAEIRLVAPTPLPGPDRDLHVVHLQGAQLVLALADAALRSGSLVFDEGSRFIVSAAPERLRGARALLRRCLARHLPDPLWTAEPADLSAALGTSSTALAAEAWRARVATLGRCTLWGRGGSGDPEAVAFDRATAHHALLLARGGRSTRADWLLIADWYEGIAARCGAP